LEKDQVFPLQEKCQDGIKKIPEGPGIRYVTTYKQVKTQRANQNYNLMICQLILSGFPDIQIACNSNDGKGKQYDGILILHFKQRSCTENQKKSNGYQTV